MNNMKSKLKQDYFNKILLNDENRPKKLWKTLKSLVPDSKNVSTSVKRLVKDDGTEISFPKLIADHFNKFFVNVGVSLASKFSSDTTKINSTFEQESF